MAGHRHTAMGNKINLITDIFESSLRALGAAPDTDPGFSAVKYLPGDRLGSRRKVCEPIRLAGNLAVIL